MKIKPTLRLTLALLFCSCSSILVAQTDSTWLDLGRIKLKKDFTQTVTIKGKDLEQMPFAKLSEAIDVWLFGLATNPNTVTYVIDGNLLTDVNVYSIYDIEEITLVQNALVQLNGATMARQLLLITTRKNNGKEQGLTIAGASYAVTNSFQTALPDMVKGQTNVDHRYYVSAYQNRKNIQYGISASYLRDVFPYPDTGYNIEKPYQVNRYTLTGYLNASLGAAHSVWLRAGFVPARYTFEYSGFKSSPAGIDAKTRQNSLFVEAGWQARFFKHLTNELSAGYTPVKTEGGSMSTYNDGGTPVSIMFARQNMDTKFRNLLLTNHLTYEADIGNWHIEPAVNISFRHLKYDNASSITNIDGRTGSTISTSTNANWYDMDVFLLTPAVNVYYKDWFNVQGGFVYNLSKAQPGNSGDKKMFPFVTSAVNVLKLAGVESKFSWKIFGSYASAGDFSDVNFTIQDLGSGFYSYPYPAFSYGTGAISSPVIVDDEKDHMIQAGTSAGIWNDRLQFSYGYDKRKHKGVITAYVPGPVQPMPINYVVDVYNTIHRFGVTARVLDNAELKWSTGLNVSSVKSIVKLSEVLSGPVVPATFLTNDPLWTGGFTNRLQYKKIMVGLDLLYALNQREYYNNTSTDDNNVSFKNIYAGYRAQWGSKAFELYAETRNPSQRNKSRLPDRRNYFGLGGKLEL